MADPNDPGVVKGTDNDDVINAGYVDGEGDSISNSQDTIFGLGGDDTIDGLEGDDTIYGDGGADGSGGAVEVQKTIDFNDLAAGAIVEDQYAGVSIYSCDQDDHPTMIFDTSNPTGGDGDLATSNLGGVLIISEDGDSSDPDDNAHGGKMVFDFDDPVSIDQLTFLDIDEKCVKVTFYDENGHQITEVRTSGQGDNSQIVQDYDVDGVAKMVVHMSGSGAIDNLIYTTTETVTTGVPGNDVIDGGDGDDLIFGNEGDDTIDGGTGNDTIYGDDGASEAERDIFEWSEGPGFANNADTPDFTQNTGNANITFTTESATSAVDTGYETSTQNTDDLDADVGENSSLSSVLNGDSNSATYKWVSDTPVENVEFRINDIDGDGRVVVYAYDENGDPIEVVLSDAGSGLALSDSDSVAGDDTATSTDNNYTNDDNSEHSVLVTISGPVSSWVVVHEQDGGNNSGINVTDIAFDVPVSGGSTGEGDDSLIGGDGGDVIYGGGGNDSIDASSDDLVDLPDLGFPSYMGYPEIPADSDPTNDLDFVDGGAGNDTILTGDDDDTIIGGSGDDSIDGGVDKDLIEGGTGDDTIIGGEGNDTIEGGDDNDLIYGGLDPSYPDALNIPNDGAGGVDPDPETENGRDLIDGGAGNDTIYGQDDNDTITGGSGDDLIDGGVDDDRLYGGDGDDQIIGGHGADKMFGGDGNDTFIVNDSTHGGGDVIMGGSGPDDTADWDVLDLSGSGPYTIDATTDSSDAGSLTGTVTFANGDVLSFNQIEEIICFTPGTAILTPSGEVAVEDLKVGDRVVTRDNGLQTIRWTGCKALTGRDLLARPKLRPIMIRAGSLAPNLPDRDLMVSPNHRMLLVSQQAQLLFQESEVLVAAKHLTHMDGVQQIDTVGVDYVHFLCDNHEVVLANGSWSESFQPGRYSMKAIDNEQREEIFELFPELRNDEALEDYTAARLSLKRHEAKLLN